METSLILKNDSDLFGLYEELGWNSVLGLSSAELAMAMSGSHCAVYVYDGALLVGTGRAVSDGVINAYICGIGVLPGYRNRGIAREITRMLTDLCRRDGLHIQLVCEESLVPMYEKMGFVEFASAMKFKEEN